MKKFYLFFAILLLYNCTLDQVIIHHGVHNLEKKQEKLKINQTNKNDVIKLIGPPSTRSSFDNDVLIYIEKKTGGSKLIKLGKKELLVNNVLVLEINERGILVHKEFYNKEDMKKINFDNNKTSISYNKRSFIYNFMASLRQKINDPLGKKRIKD